MAKVIACRSIPVTSGKRYTKGDTGYGDLLLASDYTDYGGSSGSDSNNAKRISSIVCTPGSGGYQAHNVYFYCNFNIWMAVMDDMTVYLAFNGGTVEQGAVYGDLRSWPLKMYARDHSFALTQSSSGNWNSGGSARFGSDIYPSNVSMASSGNSGAMWFSLPTAQAATIGSESLPSGYMKCSIKLTEFEHTPSYDRLYYYMAGLVDSGLTGEDLYIPSYQLNITDQEIVNLASEYYPWERKVSNSWFSLNRAGGNADHVGLFRKNNGLWSPCTNIHGTTTTKDHGFRYNNGWQKSPKSGEGA